MKKRVYIILAVMLGLLLSGCGGDAWGEVVDKDPWALFHGQELPDSDQTWAIYWYLCGSDLETEDGSATDDLMEMMEVALPENVQVVIQTGGAKEWHNDRVSAERMERYLYQGDELKLVDEGHQVNMGQSETLEDFLRFCTQRYPADRTAVIFWDHGGGSVYGAVFDENYEDDALTMEEFHGAFEAVFPLSEEAPPIDVVGFDACLMGTIDTAHAFMDVSRYLVASEEMEPGDGWSYTDWLKALGRNPGMDGAQLGQEICDSYIKGCKWYGVEDEVTLSVVDLSRLGPLVEAYESMGAEALLSALEDPGFVATFGRRAVRSENYGGNTEDEGYSNFVDLGHLAENCQDILPQKSQAVLDALEDCVIYQVKGPYREHASGLSCYYSYDGDLNDFYGYKETACSDSFQYLYDFALEGELDQNGAEYVRRLGYENELPTQHTDGIDMLEEDYPIYLDEDSAAVLEVDQETLNVLKGVYFQLAWVNVEEDTVVMLGLDNNLESDWENGIFRDNFWGYWGSIDGHLVHMEVSSEGDSYTTYTVPILLNGEEYNLRVVYDYVKEDYEILGARKGIEDNGMADKNLIQLQPGDEITTLLYTSSISGDDDFVQAPMVVFTVEEDTSFYDVDMGDGIFVMMFELRDNRNNVSYSQQVQFIVEGNTIEVEVLS